MSKLDKLFPLPLDPPGQRYFEQQRVQPTLPKGVTFIALVEDQEELCDRLEVAGLKMELQNFVAGAKAQMQSGPCSAVQAFTSGSKCYGLLVVRFPDGAIRLDLTVVEFEKRLKKVIVAELTSLLECRATAILDQSTKDDEGPVLAS